MSKLIYLGMFLGSLILSSDACFAQDAEKETNSSTTEETTKKKSYTERYLEYYDPKNHVKNYKERYKGQNYRKHYRELHQENMESFKNSHKHLNQIYQGTYDLWQQAKHPEPKTAEIFNRDKYGRKVDKDLRLSDDPIFTDIYSYRDFQYRKRGYDIDYYSRGNGFSYRDPYLWIPDPRYSIVNGEWIDDPLTRSYYSRGTKQKTLPTNNSINLPQPQPFLPAQGFYNTPYNPYAAYPDLTPPHLNNQANSDRQDAPTADDLPQAETSKDKPEDANEKRTNEQKEIQPSAPVPMQQRMQPLQRVRQQAPQSPAQIIYNQGMKSVSQRNYSKASKQFEKLISVNPSSSYVHFAYGISQFLSGEYTGSLKSLKYSEQLSSKQRTPTPNVWQMPVRTNDFQAHFKKLARYVEQNGKDTDAKNLLYLISRISSYPPDRIR